MFEELNSLFESPTIKPSFEKVHVILALFIFEENEDGIGRYRLQKELLIGSGTARSLIRKLNENINFITVLSDEKGHILTDAGQDFVKKLKQRILLIEEGDISVFKEIIIKSENNKSYFCLVRNGADKILNGIEQRDAAIKVGGIGATCLLYNGKDLIFPSQSLSKSEHNKIKVEDHIFDYVSKLINNKNSKLRENDVIIIGLGGSLEKARLAALNAAFTLL
ncbi:MAG: DUF4443 domain-containing protein [Promethearchaeota archaeon]